MKLRLNRRKIKVIETVALSVPSVGAYRYLLNNRFESFLLIFGKKCSSFVSLIVFVVMIVNLDKCHLLLQIENIAII